MPDVKLQLAQEEQRRARHGEVTLSNSPSAFILFGMEIENSQ